jgi:outer membrane protein W
VKSSLVRTAVLILVTTHASPAEAKEAGFELGFRTGYAMPFGKGSSDEIRDLREGVSGTIPIWLDLGYRLTPHFSVGAFGEYAPGFAGAWWDSFCENGNVNCSVHDIRVGAQMHYHFLPFQTLDPWLGVGAGYEWLVFSTSSGDKEASLTAPGIEFVHAQAGIDFPIDRDVAALLGPFVGFSIGQFSRFSCNSEGTICPSIQKKTLHEWLTFGIRASFVL